MEKKEPKKWSEMTPKEKKRAKINLTLLGILFCILIPLFISTCNDINNNALKEQENVEEVVHNSSWDSSVKQVKDYLKNTLNDPDSYESIEWGEVVKNPSVNWFVVRHKYRAKNAFGGTITKNQIFTLDSLGTVISVSDYNE